MSVISNKTARYVLGLGLGIALVDCGGPAKSDGDTTVLGSKVVIIPDDVARSSVRVEGPEVSLPAAQYDSVRPGTILVSGWQTGLLRSVQSVSRQDDRVIALTQPALLGDAVDRGRIEVSFKPSDCQSPSGSPARCGLTDSSIFSGLDLSNTPISEGGDLTSTLREGRITFDPTLDLVLELADGRVNQLELSATGDLDALVEIEARAMAPIKQNFSRTVWTSPPLTFFQRIGNIPIVETVVVSVEAGVEIESTGAFEGRSRVETSGRVSVGARFRDGAWTPVRTDDLGVSGSGQVTAANGHFTFRTYLRPRIDVKFFGMAGPYVTLETFGAQSGAIDPAPAWVLNGGLTGGFGSRAPEAFDLYGPRSNPALRSQGTVFTVERPIADGTFTPGAPTQGACSPFLRSPLRSEILDNGRSDGCDGLSWRFDWSDCPAASTYHLYVIRDASPVPTIDRSDLTASEFESLHASGFVASDSLAGWSWKVRARVDGSWGPWSETRRFEVEPINTDPGSAGCGSPDAGVPDAGNDPPPPLCSNGAGASTGIQFVNNCPHRVQAFWVDYGCAEVLYATIEVGGVHGQQTFAQHPWRIRNAETREVVRDVPPVGSATPITVYACD